MLFNMRFSKEELHFAFSEIRVLKPKKGLNFLSVRNHHDRSYGKGVEVEKGIYDIDGFQIRLGRYKYDSCDRIDSCCSVLEQDPNKDFLSNVVITFKNFALELDMNG
jgi:hypothetical protein